MKYYDSLIFELSRPGRKGYELPADTIGHDYFSELPSDLMRREPADLPEVSELDVVRHYTNLSSKNFGVDTGFYPLGSCTMKYNPKINEEVAADPQSNRRSAVCILCRIPSLPKALSSYITICRKPSPISPGCMSLRSIPMPGLMASSPA